MQTLIVSAQYALAMTAVAFVLGIIIARWIMRGERRLARAQLYAAGVLLAEVSAISRALNRPLPMAIHRRICNFRARYGA